MIVGDGEERAALEEKAAQSGLDDIRFCGFRNQSELPRFFDISTVFVLPARHEPWGLIVNEVMNAGRAVIVSDDVGCQPDLITDGVEGYVYPVGDVGALIEALRRYLRFSRRLRQRWASGHSRESIPGALKKMFMALRCALAQVTRKITA